MFLGIYDYTVILTYISLGISVFGISRALEGDFKVAISVWHFPDCVICLMER